MRSKFDEQLAKLNRQLTQMGAMCEEIIALVSKALIENRSGLTEKVNTLGSEINQMERDIETLCLRLLLQQQPVARDLRQISAALKMITDMERIGVQAGDIFEITSYVNKHSEKDYKYIHLMAESAIKMVTESIDAFVKRDVALAQDAIRHDDIVDDYFEKVKTALIDMIAENPKDGEYALDLLMIAKYFERIGDHAVNIAQWVVFSVTGIHKGAED